MSEHGYAPLHVAIPVLQARIAAKDALLERCRVLLADLDIRPHLVSPHPCADCGRFEKHRPGCELAALLQDLSQEQP